jgi:hypothetical protein
MAGGFQAPPAIALTTVSLGRRHDVLFPLRL